MAEPTLLTVAHTYPLSEVHAMTAFYGGKKCVITRNFQSVHWVHMLDMPTETPGDRVQRMRERNLCETRHPHHSVEVRENLLPLSPTQHDLMVQQPPQLAIFLHEDIVARMLAYEQELREWRTAELRAGRTDPGRPSYQEVFGPLDTATQHRLHAAQSLLPFHRHGDRVYTAQNCPGAGDPPSGQNFPIINTILSIPFSLLHNLPRLTALAPLSAYQSNIVVMALEIEKLWWWDPPPEMTQQSSATRAQNIAQGQQSDVRTSKPHPIHHPSRLPVTYRSKRPRTSFGISNTTPPNQNRIARVAATETLPNHVRCLIPQGAMNPHELTGGNEAEDLQTTGAGKAIIADFARSRSESIWDARTFDSGSTSEESLGKSRTGSKLNSVSPDDK